jgi:hypothetical protein
LSSAFTSGPFCEASKIPIFPILSPANMSGFSGEGWNPSEYIRSGVILISRTG